ncbi:MAG: leucine-rich repeat protein, partial [Acutalibacteraceae bacterium]
MKKNYLKSLTFLAFCVSLFAALTICASAKTVKSGNYTYDVDGKTASLVEYTGSESSVSVPSKIGSATVTKINDYAFWQNKKVTKVTLPSTVTTIGDAVFNECTSLTKVVLPKNLVTMGDSVFWFCTNLKTVVFYANAKTFGKNIFTGCNKAVTAYVVKGSPAEKYIKTENSVNLGYRYISSLKTASSVKLAVGESQKISVTISPSVVYDRRIAYSSSNEKVVSVASDGTMKASAVGKATITCKAMDGSGKTVSTTVTVVPAKASIERQSKTTLTSYRLVWTKAAGATAYRVYRYDTKTKKWVTLGDTTKNYYNVSNLSYYSSDKYRVRSYCKIGKTTYSADVSATFTAKVNYAAKVTGMTRGASTGNSIAFSWKAAAYADGYNVYLYDLGTKKYTLIKSTTSVQYTAEKLSPNCEYGFAVRAYSLDGTKKVLAKEHSGWFYFSTTPSPVTGLAVKEDSAGFDKFTVEWNKAENVSGYILSYSS